MMKKTVLVLCFFLSALFSTSAQAGDSVSVVIEIHSVQAHEGTVYVAVSLSEDSYKERVPDITFKLDPDGEVLRHEIDLPVGECVINVYQDMNHNGRADRGLFGIPREPVGISNWDGSGPPGKYKKLKVAVSGNTTVRIDLYQL